MNIAITNDLLVNGALAGTAVSFLIFGGNLFGIFAPIITGYIIAVTASYTSAFLLAGALLLAGAVIVLTLTRHPIGTPATPVNHKPALL
jgi:ACS family glucarate transporter-like MFS transporter